jgi:transposase
VIDLLKRHAIQVLRRAGHTLEEIAELVAVGKRTVQRVIGEPMITTVTAKPGPESARPGRPAKAEAYRMRVQAWLEEEPGLLTLELLRRAKLAGYDGAKSAFYDLVRSVRVATPRPVMRFEGLPGEFTQHDFGQVLVHFLDGTSRRVHFFASRLKYSRWVEVTLVPNEQGESLVRTLVEHFAALGGLPLLAVFDRPKTVALRWEKNGTVTEWNPVFAQVTLELGLGVEVCWPHAPQQKGAVENLVGWVKGSFFKQRRFLDEEDLCAQLRAWLEEVNTQRPSRATGVIPAVRRAEELPRLRPVKLGPDTLALRIPIVVGPTAYVTHDTHRYSMPPDAIGINGTLYLYRTRVRIVAGRFEAQHPRLWVPNAVSTLPAHRAELVAAVSGQRGKRYLKRQQLLDLGDPALAYLTELIHRCPRRWGHHVDQLHALLQVHGAPALHRAVVASLTAEVYGAEYVAHYLAADPTPPSQPECLL